MLREDRRYENITFFFFLSRSKNVQLFWGMFAIREKKERYIYERSLRAGDFQGFECEEMKPFLRAYRIIYEGESFFFLFACVLKYLSNHKSYNDCYSFGIWKIIKKYFLSLNLFKNIVHFCIVAKNGILYRTRTKASRSHCHESALIVAASIYIVLVVVFNPPSWGTIKSREYWSVRTTPKMSLTVIYS